MKKYINLNLINIPLIGNKKINKWYKKGYGGYGKDFKINKGLHEPVLSNFLLNHCDENTIFWDIGSAIGYFPVLLLNHYPNMKVSVWEISEKMLKPLKQNCLMLGGNFIINEYKPKNLLSYIKRNGVPNIIKIDIQGDEINFLYNNIEWIKQYTPIICLECHGKVKGEIELILCNLSEVYNFYYCYNHRKTEEPLRLLDINNENLIMNKKDNDCLIIMIKKSNKPYKEKV